MAVRIMFFISGAAALIFESLWFHETGLLFGNSVWAASIVLSSFMLGLAIGNVAAARYGDRLASPLRAYAWLEISIAIVGVLLVFGLKYLSILLIPIVRLTSDVPLLLNAIRLCLAFILMTIPAAAMGATLPILIAELTKRKESFGSILGSLYGWNTFGAVAGVLIAELVLIERFGIRGTSLIAALCNCFAAALALQYAGARRAVADLPSTGVSMWRQLMEADRRVWLVLGAAFLSGAALLSAEVIWTRIMQFNTISSTTSFAVMLAVVLAGIALGGALAGRLMTRTTVASRNVVATAFLAGTVILIGNYLCATQLRITNASIWSLAWFMIVLSFLPAVLSGALFTMQGTLLREFSSGDADAAGKLTFSNTLGATVGSGVGGFILLPFLGVQGAILLIALTYILIGVSLFIVCGAEVRGGARATATIAALGLCGMLVVSVRGDLPQHQLETMVRGADDAISETIRVVDVREGVNETIVYTQRVLDEHVLSQRLITNGHSMSSTLPAARRYMKLYTYLPVAIKDDLHNAALISFGVGSTAKSLVDTAGLRSIDIIDISRDVLEMSRGLYPDDHPLDDPRVNVFIEDGRQHMLTTDTRYDLITAEPPPLKHAGITNLYSQDYFGQLYDALNDGGLVTYWLPIYQLYEEEALGVVKGFCAAFEDCTLWHATSLEWMLVGSKNFSGPRDADFFAKQWSDPVVGPELHRVAFDVPDQLSGLFIAGSQTLHAMTKNALPLTDDFPRRISAEPAGLEMMASTYTRWLNPDRSKREFLTDPFVARTWPQSMRADAGRWIDLQHRLYYAEMFRENIPEKTIAYWHQSLASNDALKNTALWLFDLYPEWLPALRGASMEGIVMHDDFDLKRALMAMLEHDWGGVHEWLGVMEQRSLSEWELSWYHCVKAYAFSQHANEEEVSALLTQLRKHESPEREQYVQWIEHLARSRWAQSAEQQSVSMAVPE